MKFRDLKANEINVRIARVKDTEKSRGVTLLLYKDARCDANILDETVGSENWTNRFYECKGNLYCSLGIRNNADEPFVFKDDCGAESYTEKEKGEASDAFKRAGFKWGIGRELYTAPFIWVKGTDCNIKDGKCLDTFYVKHIKIEDKKIVQLVIFNNKTEQDCFTYGMPKEKNAINNQNSNSTMNNSQAEYVLEPDLRRLVKKLKELNIEQKTIADKYGVSSLRKLTTEQYEECFNSLMGM